MPRSPLEFDFMVEGQAGPLVRLSLRAMGSWLPIRWHFAFNQGKGTFSSRSAALSAVSDGLRAEVIANPTFSSTAI